MCVLLTILNLNSVKNSITIFILKEQVSYHIRKRYDFGKMLATINHLKEKGYAFWIEHMGMRCSRSSLAENIIQNRYSIQTDMPW